MDATATQLKTRHMNFGLTLELFWFVLCKVPLWGAVVFCDKRAGVIVAGVNSGACVGFMH